MACSLRNIAMLCFLIQPMGTRVQSFDYTVLAVSVDKTGSLTAQNGSEADADGTRMAMNVGGEERMNTTRLVDQQLVVATSLANATSDTALNSSVNTSSTELVLAGEPKRKSSLYSGFKVVKHVAQKTKRLFNVIAWAGFISEKGKVLQMITGGDSIEGLLLTLDNPMQAAELAGGALLTGAEALKNSPIFLAAGPVGLASSGFSLIDSFIKMIDAAKHGNWCAVKINGIKFLATSVSVAISAAVLFSEFGADGGVVVGSVAGASNFAIKKGCDYLLKKWCNAKIDPEEETENYAQILKSDSVTLNPYIKAFDDIREEDMGLDEFSGAVRATDSSDPIITQLWPRYGSDAFDGHGQHDPVAAPLLATVNVQVPTEGWAPGETVTFNYDGKMYEVVPPQGVLPGDTYPQPVTA